MCAFKNHNPPKRDSSPSAILSRNKHSHPALKQLHDQAFGFNADTGSPLGLGAKDRLGSLQSEFGSSSNPGTPTRSTTPGGGGGGENDTSSLGGKSSSKKASKRNHRSNQTRQNSLLKHKLDSIPPNLQGFYQNANHRHTRHHHNHHHHHAHHGSPFAGPYENFSRHALSKDNLSVQNLSSLGRMVDDRTGYNEDKRVSDEDLNQIAKQKNGKGLREYYERLNSILDSWREVDEILDSKFPEEVMLRFGSVEEVESFNKRKRLPWLDGEGESDASESGYQEESEESDDEARQRNGKSSFARAASAISGLWFGASSTPPVNKYSYNSSQRDEEQGLLSSSASGTPVKERRSPLVNKRYGATGASFGTPGSGLTTIADDNMEGGTSSTVSATNNTSQPSLSAKERNGRFSQSPPNVGTVRSTSPSGETPKALENDVATDKVQKKNGEQPIQRKRVYRRRSQEDSGTASDDEFDEDETDGGIQAGKLDAKIAAEHEERKSRAKTRENVLPGTNGATIKADEFERNQSTSTDREQQKKGAQFGGVSERERIRLLQHVPGRQEREGEREKGVQFAININLAVNVLLLAGKAIAVISSNSVSLIASLVDSALDLLSTVIIFGTSKAISYRSFHTYFKYPVGKKRFEPLGVVIFAVLMIASFCQVLVESVERLFAVIRSGNETPNEAAELPLIGIAFMVLTIIIKTFMWFIYRKSHSSGVRAVAQDAENDVVFNIASLIFPVIGSKLGWPALDPIGGVCLSIYIIAEWLETLTETITKLSGAVGSSQDISRALYLILRFRSVNSVSALEVYHAGDDMIVEADVVLPHTMALKEAHDAGEVITYGMELLSGIERAYIHLDYNPVGQAGHVAQRG